MSGGGTLWAAAQDTAYLARFNRREYAKAFRAYRAAYLPQYEAAVRGAGAAGLAALAGEVLDGLEAGWSGRPFWTRGARRVDEKQMVVTYLTPMLLSADEPLCATFEAALREAWNARRPRDPYRAASYETLAKGFRNVILGVDLAGKHIDAPEPEEKNGES